MCSPRDPTATLPGWPISRLASKKEMSCRLASLLCALCPLRTWRDKSRGRAGGRGRFGRSTGKNCEAPTAESRKGRKGQRAQRENWFRRAAHGIFKGQSEPVQKTANPLAAIISKRSHNRKQLSGCDNLHFIREAQKSHSALRLVPGGQKQKAKTRSLDSAIVTSPGPRLLGSRSARSGDWPSPRATPGGRN